MQECGLDAGAFERNLYEKAEKRKDSKISAQESVPLPGGTAAEK